MLRTQRLLPTLLRQQSTSVLPNAALPPRFTLATVRSFPSLEPLTFVPVPTTTLNAPLRRDILWKAVVYENDNKRVGSSNPPSRSENGYSRRKLLPQKGSGRARAGDANSPTRHNGARALARHAPNDYTSELPAKVYKAAFNNALSHQYRQGNLVVIGAGEGLCEVSESDMNEMEVIGSEGDAVVERMLSEFGMQNKSILFVVDEPRETLLDATERFKEKIDIVSKEMLDVNDILRARKVFIEKGALEYLAVMNHV